jgi:hypothetical protein
MKKLLFIPIIASLFLFAAEDNNSTKAEDKKNAEQIITMQNLEVAMATIRWNLWGEKFFF